MPFSLARIFPKESGGPTTRLVLDLGSCFLRTAVFSYNKQKATLLSCVELPQKSGTVQSGMIVNVATVREVLETAVHEACLNGGGRPNAVLCGLSGEAAKDFYTAVRLNREKPERPLTDEELKKLAAKIKEVAFLEVERELTEVTGSREREAEIVDLRLADFKVDGYPLNEPGGFTGKTLEVSLISTVSPTTYTSRLQSLFKGLNLPKIQTVSQMSAVAALLCREEPHLNALLLDIGGEKTDLAIVFGGWIVGSRTFSLGGRQFTQVLREKLTLSETEAENRKLAYSHGELSEQETAKIKELLAPMTGFWLKCLETAVSDFAGIKAFPDKILLSGGGSLLPEVATSLRSFPWTNRFPFLTSPQITGLPSSLLNALAESRLGRELVEKDLPLIALGLKSSGTEDANHHVDHFFRV